MDILIKLIDPNTNAPITGGSANIALKLLRHADNFAFDWNDSAFKSSGWTAVAATMTEVNAGSFPGVYKQTVSTATWNDGEYSYDATYADGSVSLYFQGTTRVQDGADALTALFADIYALTHNEAGDPIVRVIPLPETAGTCVLYEYCYDLASAQPLASVTATAHISALPYDYGGKLHTGAVISGAYNPVDGLVSWEIVHGATVTVNIKEVGILSSLTIPAAAQARIAALLT